MADGTGALALMWSGPRGEGNASPSATHPPHVAQAMCLAEATSGVFSRRGLRLLAGHTLLRAAQVALAFAVIWCVIIGAGIRLTAAVLVTFAAVGIAEQRTRSWWRWATPITSSRAAIRRRLGLGALALAYAALAVGVFLHVAVLDSPLVVLPAVVLIVGAGLVQAVRLWRRRPDCADPPDPPVWPKGAEEYALVAMLARAQSLSPTWLESVTGQPRHLVQALIGTLNRGGLVRLDQSAGQITQVALTERGRTVHDLARAQLREISASSTG